MVGPNSTAPPDGGKCACVGAQADSGWQQASFAENMAVHVRSGKPLVLLFHCGEIADGHPLADLWHSVSLPLRKTLKVDAYPVDTREHPAFVDDFVAHLMNGARSQKAANLAGMMGGGTMPRSVVFADQWSVELIPREKHFMTAATYLKAVSAAMASSERQQEAALPAANDARLQAENARLAAQNAALAERISGLLAASGEQALAAPAAAKAEPGKMVCCLVHASWCEHCRKLVAETWTEKYQDELRSRGILVFSVEIKSKGGHDAEQMIVDILPMFMDAKQVPSGVPCTLIMHYKDGHMHADAFAGWLPTEEYKETLDKAMEKLKAIKALDEAEAPAAEPQQAEGLVGGEADDE